MNKFNLICAILILLPTVTNAKAAAISEKKINKNFNILEKKDKSLNLVQNEYSIFNGESYDKFKTKKYEKLELTESCFKDKLRPKCDAYEFSQIKPKKLNLNSETFNNISAVACEAVYGINLLALDSKNNEYNFCKFKDGSMVNSWSLYYKHFPKEEAK